MARYILLAVDDNDAAQKLVDMIEKWDNTIEIATNPEATIAEDVALEQISVFVRGMYAKPTIFCSCAMNKNSSFTRGKKYGWMVHAQCGKPRRAWAEGHDWFAHLGVNLLPVSTSRPEYRGRGMQGHIWDGYEYKPEEPTPEG